MTIERAAATADDTLDQTSDTLVDSMTISPAAGDYLAVFTSYFETDAISGSEANTFSIYVGGSVVDHSERNYDENTSVDTALIPMVLSCKVSPNGSQAVEVRYRTANAASPVILKKRELNLFPIIGTDVEVSSTGDKTFTGSNDVYTAVLTATTPPAGDYLLTFSTSAQGPTGSEIAFKVTVGGSDITHTIRKQTQESSWFASDFPFFIACKVSPNGSQDVVVEWTRTAGSGTLTAHEMTMNLIPTAAGDIFEASGTANDTDSTQDDVLIDDMTITDPGADDYLVLFSSYSFRATASDDWSIFTIRTAGVRVTDSERLMEHEESIDATEIPVMASYRVTVEGATDDLEMYWEGRGTATERIIRHRTLVAIREGEPAAAPTFLSAQGLMVNP